MTKTKGNNYKKMIYLKGKHYDQVVAIQKEMGLVSFSQAIAYCIEKQYTRNLFNKVEVK